MPWTPQRTSPFLSPVEFSLIYPLPQQHFQRLILAKGNRSGNPERRSAEFSRNFPAPSTNCPQELTPPAGTSFVGDSWGAWGLTQRTSLTSLALRRSHYSLVVFSKRKREAKPHHWRCEPWSNSGKKQTQITLCNLFCEVQRHTCTLIGCKSKTQPQTTRLEAFSLKGRTTLSNSNLQIASWSNVVNIEKNKERVSLMHKLFKIGPRVLREAEYNRAPAGCFTTAPALNAKKSHGASTVASAPIQAL